MKIAKTNIVGPAGELVERDKPLPSDWDPEYVQSLVDSGGAADIEDVATPTDIEGAQ